MVFPGGTEVKLRPPPLRHRTQPAAFRSHFFLETITATYIFVVPVIFCCPLSLVTLERPRLTKHRAPFLISSPKWTPLRNRLAAVSFHPFGPLSMPNLNNLSLSFLHSQSPPPKRTVLQVILCSSALFPSTQLPMAPPYHFVEVHCSFFLELTGSDLSLLGLYGFFSKVKIVPFFFPSSLLTGI